MQRKTVKDILAWVLTGIGWTVIFFALGSLALMGVVLTVAGAGLWMGED